MSGIVLDTIIVVINSTVGRESTMKLVIGKYDQISLDLEQPNGTALMFKARMLELASKE